MDWQGIGVIAAIIGGCVTAATVYLRLFVRDQIHSFQDQLLARLHAEFVPTPVGELRWRGLESRLDHLERDVRLLQDRCP